jgi:hypothetical protein
VRARLRGVGALAIVIAGVTAAHAQPGSGSGSGSGAAANAAVFDQTTERAAGCGAGAVDALLDALPLARSPGAAADAMFSTARACETGGGDPSIALALYQRILRDYGDERAAVGANLRAKALVALIGDAGEGAEEARELAELRAAHGFRPDDAVLERAAALARSTWPGAGEAALWRADRLRELDRLAEAAAAYDDLLARFPGSRWARPAGEGAAAVAIERSRFDEARRRIAALPAGDPADEAVRADLSEQLVRREQREAWYVRSWFGLAAAVAILLASLIHAGRSPRRILAALRPPVEVLFAAPVVAVLIIMSLTGHFAIGPAVEIIAGGGLAIAWLSAAGLVAARDAGLTMPPRVAVHIVATLVAVAATAYIGVMHGDLLEMLIETLAFGPDH